MIAMESVATQKGDLFLWFQGVWLSFKYGTKDKAKHYHTLLHQVTDKQGKIMTS